jgi:hypothetical protein
MSVRQDTIICDLDGTLCNIEHRLHHVQRQGDGKLQRKPDWDAFFKAIPEDTLNESVWATIRSLRRGNKDFSTIGQRSTHRIIFCSGRPERTREDTLQWLDEKAYFSHDVTLYMRKDGDRRSDAIVKQEILDAHIDKDHVLFVLDDRQCVVDMWRKNGMTCFQVAPGNF